MMISAILPENDYFLVLGLAIILFTGLAFGKISKWLKIPNVTGYLLGGFFLGPAIVQLFNPTGQGVLSENYIHALKIIADIELAFIAFTIGTEFKLEYFKRLGLAPVVIAFTEAFFAVVFITLGMLLFGFPLHFALAMGAVGGATAPAATIMVIRQYKAKGPITETIFSVVAIDDASGLIFFGFATAFIRLIVNPQTDTNLWLAALMPFIEIGLSVLIGLVLGFLMSLMMKWFTGRGNRTSIVVGTLFLAIALARIAQYDFDFGISSLMIAMALGAMYTNISPTVDMVVPLIERITPPLVILFFTLSGADLMLPMGEGGLTTLIILGVYLSFRVAGKIIGTWIGGKASKAPEMVNKYLGFGLLPQGGIALGLSLILMDLIPVSFDPFYNGMTIRVVVIGAVFFSEIFGPILLKWVLFKTKEAQVKS